MFPLILLSVLVLLLLAQVGVMKAARKVGGAGRSMTTGYPFDPFDPQRLR
jgi:hypothetical protein